MNTSSEYRVVYGGREETQQRGRFVILKQSPFTTDTLEDMLQPTDTQLTSGF